MQTTMTTNSILNEEEVILMRNEFLNKYCRDKNWDITNLEFEQILEIRSHKEWTNPGLITG